MKISEKNICESCGIPMHKLADFGTNKDSTINTEYCHFCYLQGKLVDHGIILEQKIEKNFTMSQKMGMPREEAIISARNPSYTQKMERNEAC